MRRDLVLLLLVLLVSAGCTQNVGIALRPDYSTYLKAGNELSKLTQKITFFKGEYSDKRPDPRVLASYNKGEMTYNFIEERDVDEAFYEGLEGLMKTSGHLWSNTGEGDVKVNLQFVNCQADYEQGLVTAIYIATTGVQIKLDFLDSKTGDMIYTNIYSGSDERKKAYGGAKGLINESIDASIINCIQAVGDDASLAIALKKLGL